MQLTGILIIKIFFISYSVNFIRSFYTSILFIDHHRWFEREPQVVNLFPRFSGKSMDELRLISRVRSHGTHIFCAMDGIIRNLHKDEVVDELLADLRRDHIHVKDTISEEEFQVLVESKKNKMC